ncbi:MAG: nitroreductase [Coriobacteriia bacterium]|nr:nitroreductase [Coriobacteriia bacterium]
MTDFFAQNGPAWLAAVARRISRRAFDSREVDAEKLDALDAVCKGFRPHPDARTVLVREPAVDVFSGILGSYGKVTGTRHVLLFIGAGVAPARDNHVGYTGEAAILEATALGLNTCWIGGFFSPARTARVVELAPDERVLAVSPVGHAFGQLTLTERGMRGLSGAHERIAVARMAPGSVKGGWPQWAVAAVETARLAPSAMNRQPWRFRFDAGALVIARDNPSETPKVTKRLDCGIAMLHAELGARASGADGAWRELSTGLDLARYVTTRRS